MNFKTGVSAFLVSSCLSGFLLTFFFAGFHGNTYFGKKLIRLRDMYFKLLPPFKSWRAFFVRLLIFFPVQLIAATLGPIILLKTIMGPTVFGAPSSSLNILIASQSGGAIIWGAMLATALLFRYL